MSWHPFFHKTPPGKPNILKPGWRSTLFETVVIATLAIILYFSCNEKHQMMTTMLKMAQTTPITVDIVPDEANMRLKVQLACEASGLTNIKSPYEWWLIVSTLGAKESGRGHWKTVENPKGYEKTRCKLNQTSQAMGWGQILPTAKERVLLRLGLPVYRCGLDIVNSEFGNILYTCIHFKGKLKDAGVISFATENQVWEGVRRYNGAGPEAKAYSIIAKRMYFTLKDRFRSK